MSRHLWQAGRSLAAVVLFLSVGCRERPTTTQPTEPTEKYESLASGWKPHVHFTWVDTVHAKGWVWKDRDLIACVAVMGNDEQSARPACLVLARVPAGWEPATTHTVIGDSVFQTKTQLNSSGPASPTVVYQRKPADKTETFFAGKREFSVANGRVFLVAVKDSNVSSVHQIRAGLGGFFENPVDFPNLAEEVTALRKTNPQLQRFWVGEDPDAEDGD
jgi:hypothetical protein